MANSDERGHRRARGIYYSPEDVVRCMIQWAVRGPSDRVFDPSFGGCVFLSAAVEELDRLGSAAPATQVFGTDWDKGAWPDAMRLVTAGAARKQFALHDFLSWQPRRSRLYDIVAGNPPYVRPDRLPDAALEVARTSLPEAEFLPRKASYWAYFVLHSLRFLKRGGRLAFVLPGAFLRADYAQPVRVALAGRFTSVEVIAIEERIFEDAEEAATLVLCDGYLGGPGEVRVVSARRADLAEAVEGVRSSQALSEEETHQDWARHLAGQDALEIYEGLRTKYGRLGDYAAVRVGVVTGNNGFFLPDDETVRTWNLEPEVLRHIAWRTQQLDGAVLLRRDLDLPRKRMLFAPATASIPPGAADYIRHGEAEGVGEGYKCSRRAPWYVPPDLNPPHAIMSAMVWERPRVALNRCRALCTNTLLCVCFRRGAPRTGVIASLLSTVGQFGAEIEGRVCGGGLLKIEPADAKRIVSPRVRLARSDTEWLDRVSRTYEPESLARAVDEKLAGQVGAREMRVLRSALRLLRARRHGENSAAI